MKIKCPNCGYNLKYRILNQDAFCESCGSSIDITKLNCDFNSIDEYSCKSCGAKIKSIDENVVIECNYCGSKNFTKNIMKFDYKPIGILPFLYEKDIFKEKVIEFLKNENAKNTAKKVKKAKIYGIYLPYSYQNNFFAEKTINTKSEYDNSNKKKAGIVSNFSTFSNINSLNEILPYDLKQYKNFNPIYLDGFVAYDIKQRFINDYFGSRKPEFYWVPIWIIKTGLKGDIFMNAQTGEIAGNYLFIDKVPFLRNKGILIATVSIIEILLILLIIFLVNITIKRDINLLVGIGMVIVSVYVIFFVLCIIYELVKNEIFDDDKYLKSFHFRINRN